MGRFFKNVSRREVGLTGKDFSYGAGYLFGRGERFDEEKPHIETAGFAESVFVVGIAEDDDGDFSDVFVGSERFEHIKPIQSRHLQVEKDNVGVFAVNEGESDLAVFCRNHIEPFGGERDGVHIAYIRFIVDEADLASFRGEFRCGVVHRMHYMFVRAFIVSQLFEKGGVG